MECSEKLTGVHQYFGIFKKTLTTSWRNMYKSIIWGLAASILLGPVYGQSDPFARIGFVIGYWEGTGEGFGNNNSTIESRFIPVMDGKYVEAMNESWFDPAGENPQGEHHIDKGFFSYDKQRAAIVYRQFNNEGYMNQYTLNETLSSDSLLVFDTEFIENFLPGGKARITFRKISGEEMETIFDVSFPDSGYTCFGTNHLKKKPPGCGGE